MFVVVFPINHHKSSSNPEMLSGSPLWRTTGGDVGCHPALPPHSTLPSPALSCLRFCFNGDEQKRWLSAVFSLGEQRAKGLVSSQTAAELHLSCLSLSVLTHGRRHGPTALNPNVTIACDQTEPPVPDFQFYPSDKKLDKYNSDTLSLTAVNMNDFPGRSELLWRSKKIKKTTTIHSCIMQNNRFQ